jgi:putative FmdB family regulatory protein
MPTYDYRCNACDHRFEAFQSMKDAPKRKCPKCAKNALERLIGTGAAVLFKGSGFYQTDYRTEGYKKSAAADAPGTATKADAKPESKPATSSPSVETKPKPSAKAKGD